MQIPDTHRALALASRAHTFRPLPDQAGSLSVLVTVQLMAASSLLALACCLAPSARAADLGCFGTREQCSTLPMGSALRLAEMVDAAQNRHPLIRGARAEKAAADIDVDTVKRGYWPTLSTVTEAGSSSATPSHYIQLEQTLWDWGRTAGRVRIAESGASSAEAVVAVQRLNLGAQVITAWAELINAVLRRQIAGNSLERLSVLEAMMQRRVQSELSTAIDLELARARVTQTEVEIQVAEASARTAVTRLQQLIGDRAGTLPTAVLIPTIDETEPQVIAMLAADWESIATMQPNVLRARHDAITARRRVEVKRSEALPQLYLRVNQYLSGTRSAGGVVGLSYTPGAGFSTALEVRALAQRVVASDEAVEAALVEARESIFNDRNAVETGAARLASALRSVRGAEIVRDSYTRQFTAGRKSWLDLLNAVREVTQAEYSVVDARASVLGAVGRLKLRAEQ